MVAHNQLFAALASPGDSLSGNVISKFFHVGSNLVAPIEMPSVGEMVHAYVHGTLGRDQVFQASWIKGCFVTLSESIGGVYTTDDRGVLHVNLKPLEGLTPWMGVAAARIEVPSFVETLTLLNREVIDRDVARWWLTRRGVMSGPVIDSLIDLQYEVPGPADLVRFAVRHVFEPDLIAYFGYNAEFRPILDCFHHAQGVDYPILTGPLKTVVDKVLAEKQPECAASLAAMSPEERADFGGCPGTADELRAEYTRRGIPEPTWANAYWWSHWVLPSPTQGYQMLYRFRPDRDRSGEEPWVQQINFSLPDLRKLLRANDYPPFWRDKLAAISYLLPGRIDTRRLYQLGIWTERNVYENYLSLGYAPKDAQALTTFTVKQATQAETKALCKWTCANLREAIYYGVVDHDGAVEALQGQGLSPLTALTQVETVERSLDLERTKKAVKASVRRRKMGLLDDGGFRDQLRMIGLPGDRIDALSQEVGWELQGGSATFGASRIQEWACKGLITLQDADERLGRLGYPADQRLLVLAQITDCILRAQSKMALAAQRTETQRAREAARQVKEAEAAAARARRTLAAHGSPSQIARWRARGLITEAMALDRLRKLEWPDADALNLLREAETRVKTRQVEAPVD